ncbi:Phagosome maturation inhibitor, PmiA [Mycobacterium marinum M]|uniref:Phagosome maturation inhibitor, PmiA n=2 Tax=Mycobacterium marinum TaxID=1781 RepID=B2HIQ5_MYCMM|nr:Phagosome maturation inhibitor, PmiA [Mycobacterium marinum M]
MRSHSMNELYELAPDIRLPTSTRPNPLIDRGALNEAEFIDMRLSPQRSRVGVIFDIRWCDFTNSNAALLVLTCVGRVAWSNDASRQHPWYSTRGYWIPETILGAAARGDELWAKDASGPETAARMTAMPPVENQAEYILKFDWLSISGLTARIYIGHIDGLGDAPPDMTDSSDAEIIAGFPQWSSTMEVHEYYTYTP